jgi:hypothetical protein
LGKKAYGIMFLCLWMRLCACGPPRNFRNFDFH